MFVWTGMLERPEVLGTVLELELQAVMSHLAWVLGAELILCKSGMHVHPFHTGSHYVSLAGLTLTG